MNDMTDQQVVDLACARLTDAAAGDIHSKIAEDLIDAAEDLRDTAKTEPGTVAVVRALMFSDVTLPAVVVPAVEDDDEWDVYGDLAYES